MISRRDLEQYRDMAGECEELRLRITRLQACSDMEHDKVHGSMASWPYIERTFTVAGMPRRRSKQLTACLILLRQKEVELAAKLGEIEAWLDTVQDARTRRIIRLRYVDGLSWRTVARRVYGSPHYEDAARKIIERLF